MRLSLRLIECSRGMPVRAGVVAGGDQGADSEFHFLTSGLTFHLHRLNGGGHIAEQTPRIVATVEADPHGTLPRFGAIHFGFSAAVRARGPVAGAVVDAVFRLVHGVEQFQTGSVDHAASLCQYLICRISAAMRAIISQSQ